MHKFRTRKREGKCLKNSVSHIILGLDYYTYGFNGMERDDEVKGSGNSYDFGARIYDSRLGRWLSTDYNPRLGKWLSRDPLASKFPWQSPYVSMDNNPILLTDIFGDSTNYFNSQGELIHQSHDNLENLIVTIEKDQEDAFNNRLNLAHDGNSDKVNEALREFGIGYAIDDFKKFYRDNDGVQAPGWSEGYFSEFKTYLYLKDGLVRPGPERIQGDADYVSGPSLFPNFLGDLHFHTNYGKPGREKYSTFGHEPSDDDKRTSMEGSYKHFDVVVTSKYIYFINNQNSFPVVIPTNNTFGIGNSYETWDPWNE